MSERWARRLVNQPRGTQSYQPTQREDEDQLTQAIIELARQYRRYGYRRITALLQHAGWRVGRDVRQLLVNTGAKTLYIEPGSPRKNGYCEWFNSKLRDEFLNGEIFYSMKELRATLLAGLQATSSGGVVGKQQWEWKSGKHTTISTTSHPRRRRLSEPPDR